MKNTMLSLWSAHLAYEIMHEHNNDALDARLPLIESKILQYSKQ